MIMGTQAKHKNHKRAPLVAIMGVDGSGKSTVIEAIKEEFETNQNRDVHIWYRNKKFVNASAPIAHHNLPPYSRIVSIGKLLYKAIRWTFSYYTHIATLREKGSLVLCDHFYFYYIAIDPLRFRYGGPQWLAWEVAKRIPRPNISILLTVTFDVVNQRKEELPRETMYTLIQAHQQLEQKLPDVYSIDANRSLHEVVHEVLEIINNKTETSESPNHRVVNSYNL